LLQANRRVKKLRAEEKREFITHFLAFGKSTPFAADFSPQGCLWLYNQNRQGYVSQEEVVIISSRQILTFWVWFLLIFGYR
jgi:hypothetical protein